MSHYAIVKRQRYWIKPIWRDRETEFLGGMSIHFNNHKEYGRYSQKLIKCEKNEFEARRAYYINVIREVREKGLIITYWEGEITFEPLQRGETLTIGNEKFTIREVEKNINGQVIYLVSEQLIEKVENYNELLMSCEKMYDDYSNQLKLEEEEKARKNKELIDNFYKSHEQARENRPWWKRLFG